MAATKENPIVFYDLHDGNGSSWALNPYKTRLCLIHKGLPYRVEYLAIHEVEPKMKELGVAPSSDTFPHYTLPAIADPSNDPDGKPTYVSESFAIAMYLDEKYPAPKYPAIFPPGTEGVQHILAHQYFPSLIILIATTLSPKMLQFLDEQSLNYVLRTRPPELFKPLPEEEQAKRWEDIRDKFVALDKSLDINGGHSFIMGDRPSFVDFVLGGIFCFVEKLDGPQMKAIAGWHDGKWGDYWGRLKEIEANSSCVY